MVIDSRSQEFHGRRMLFLSNDHNTTSPVNLWFVSTALMGAATSLLAELFGYLYVPYVTLTVWLAAKSFSMCVCNAASMRITWPEIYERYQVIRDLCEVANGTFGTLIGVYTACAVVAFTVSLDAILSDIEIVYQLSIVFMQIASVVGFLLAADVPRQVLKITEFKCFNLN